MKLGEALWRMWEEMYRCAGCGGREGEHPVVDGAECAMKPLREQQYAKRNAELEKRRRLRRLAGLSVGPERAEVEVHGYAE